MAVDSERAKSLFLAASDLPDPGERAAYLDRECNGDRELRERVEALLCANDASPMSEPGPRDTAGTSERRVPTRPREFVDLAVGIDTVIAGKFKLVEEIGQGGMGHVYMAQQTEPIRRAVAVKVIKAGMDSKAVLARFEAERQALAMMDHPNIARVHDAGVTDSGRPYFVMELIKGVPITEFCDAGKLTIRQRLELFVPVCQAIQHAHQKGIIHRDIKPSNVLVALYDDRPVPKVIDFGVAKAVGQPLTDHTFMTGFGAVVGTPEYMSPEQASFNQVDVDTRSDIYALGVLLYELLTGSTPIDRRSLGKAALLEVLRIVREVEVPRPSAKLSTLDTLPNVAANRGIEPTRLSKVLRGELDWVLLKALEKDRTRRYDTVNALARDIQRHLADEMVDARPPSPGYRLKKFVRRNKSQMIAASLVVFALLIGLAAAMWGLLEARRQSEAKELARQAEEKQRIEADAKRREAETNLAFATKGNEILGSVFEELNPNRNYETVAELRSALGENLKKAVTALEGSAIGDPLIVAEMQHTLGISLFFLGDMSSGLLVLEKAAETRKVRLGLDHPTTLRTQAFLGDCYRSAGKFDLAVRLLENTVKVMTAKLGPEDQGTLMTMNHLANAYGQAGKPELALPIFEKIVAVSKARHGPHHRDTLLFMNNLGTAYSAAHRPDRAQPLFEETLAQTKVTYGPTHLETLACMNNLGQAYLDAGKLNDALLLLEEAFRLMKVKLGPTHTDTVACMGTLATAYRTAGRLDRAVFLLKEALDGFRAKLPPDHPHVLSCLSHLAVTYSDQGKHDLALPLLEEALKLTADKLGPDHRETLERMNNVAATYWLANQLDKSVPMFEETLRLKIAKIGRDEPWTQLTVANLGVNYKDTGRLAEAIPLLEEAHRALKTDPRLRWVGEQLLDAYAKAGEKAKGINLCRETLDYVRRSLPNGSPKLAAPLATSGLALLRIEAFAEAEPLIRECLAIREKHDADAWTTFNTQSMLGGALLGQKKHHDAEPLLIKGYEGMKQREQMMPKGGTRIPEALDRLIELYTVTNRPDQATKWRAEREKYRAAPARPEKK
jgi:serine/threonine protein kinase/tetratricopeptide (TPR) repeat protein